MSSVASESDCLQSIADLRIPPGNFLFGNALQMPSHKFHQVIEQWFEEYGDPYRFRIGKVEFVAIANSELARSVMQQRPAAFRRIRRVEETFAELGFNGVFSAEGDDWKRQRKLIMPSFRTRQLELLYPIIARIAHVLLARCEHAAQTGEAVDILKLMMQFSVDVTTEISFGYPLNTLQGENGELQEHLALVFPGIFRRVLAPYRYWRWLKLPSDRALERSVVYLRKTVGDIVHKTREQLAANPQLARAPQNLLQVMLSPAEQSDELPLSEDELFANVVTLLLAGEDTTANGLAWALHHLALAPELQEKAAAQSQQQLGANDLIDSLSDIRKLPYLAAVTEEVMRLRSPAPFLFLEANTDTVVGSLAIPQGTALAIMTRHVGMSSELFSEPQQFRPERWLGLPDSDTKDWRHTPRAQLAFGGGPRVCPGRSLALFETQLVLSALLRRFEFSHATPAEEVVEHMAFTMYPKNLKLHLKVRA